MSKNSFLKNMFFIMATMIFVGPSLSSEVVLPEHAYDPKKPSDSHGITGVDSKNTIKDQTVFHPRQSAIDIAKVAVPGEKSSRFDGPSLTFPEAGDTDPLSRDDTVLTGQIVVDTFQYQHPIVARPDFSKVSGGDGSEKTQRGQLVVARMQDLAQAVKKEQGQLKQDFFTLNMIIIDSITDGTSLQQGKIRTMHTLLDEIVAREQRLTNAVSSVDQSFDALELSKNDFSLSTVNELIAGKAALQEEWESLLDITLNSYQKISSGLQTLRENVLQSDDHIREIKELDECAELLDTHVQDVLEKKKGKDREKCFFLAGKVEVLREKFNSLKQDYETFHKKNIITNDFKDALQTVKQSLDELKNDKEAMANCPFVVEQRRELTKQLNAFLKQIRDTPTQK